MVLWPLELIFIVIIGIPIYFLPSIVAFSRGVPAAGGIFLLNLLLGWIVLGWIASLIWSVAAPKRQPVVINTYRSETVRNNRPEAERPANKDNKSEPYDQKLDRLQKLKELFDKGALSEEEFNSEKRKILENR